MGTLERRNREREEVRDLILNAARELFVEQGVEAVTMRAIAKRIEYTPTTIYHHFRDKHALLVELCIRDFQALGQAFLKIGRVADPLERLQRIGRAYVEFGIENPSHYRFLFMTPRIGATEEEIHERMSPEEDAYMFLLSTVQEAIDAGLLREDLTDAEQVAQMLWSGVHGLVSLRIAMGDDDAIEWRDVRATARLMTEATVRGLLR